MISKFLLISLFAGICGIDNYNGLLHFHRPVITGAIIGLILGDLKTGLIAGASIEFVWMAMVPLAGAQPPNVVIGGILGTTFTIITKQDPSIAVSLALPFALLGQVCIVGFFSLFTIFNKKIDATFLNPETLNAKKFENYMYLWLFIDFMINFILVFIPLYFGATKATDMISSIPDWVMAGMGGIGKIMPAVGFAMLMKIMFKNIYLPFFCIGFIFSAYLHLPIITIALIGASIAGYDYMLNKDIEKNNNSYKNITIQEEDFSNGI